MDLVYIGTSVTSPAPKFLLGGTYLLLAYLKFVLRLSWSLHQMLRVLQLNLFDRRPLLGLFTTPSPPGSPDPQMLLWC